MKRNKRGIYRSRNGVLVGVCRGLAESFDLSVFWVRIAMVIVFLLSGFWPVIGIYIVAALLMKPEPVRPIENEEEQEFYDSYTYSPQNAAQRIRRKYENLERRIRRMEDKVTGRDYEWEQKFNS
ncbi:MULTISPECIES: envelope stress response membrane protein PspC [Desulfosediminicola]|uniref:envelope stress response membrane protein PspC n=1 Tax=Desulfosediminicola TaxID=2886823 RepID=UPI0010AD310D|nr:envelope stress response membrane protein PspC [Desulfosediminicola ganghwensis]